ncbi:hypothetical protein PENTCL1PPCAC_4356, partial [Pristionchus entomophagus]
KERGGVGKFANFSIVLKFHVAVDLLTIMAAAFVMNRTLVYLRCVCGDHPYPPFTLSESTGATGEMQSDAEESREHRFPHELHGVVRPFKSST